MTTALREPSLKRTAIKLAVGASAIASAATPLVAMGSAAAAGDMTECWGYSSTVHQTMVCAYSSGGSSLPTEVASVNSEKTIGSYRHKTWSRTDTNFRGQAVWKNYAYFLCSQNFAVPGQCKWE